MYVFGGYKALYMCNKYNILLCFFCVYFLVAVFVLTTEPRTQGLAYAKHTVMSLTCIPRIEMLLVFFCISISFAISCAIQ